MRIKQPAVAGLFYPERAAVLDAQVQGYLDAVGDDGTNRQPRALIVPHAGYPYSGPTAAHAFATLRRWADEFDRVAILAPSHRVALGGIATSSADLFETPLGQVAVDRDAVSALNNLSNVETLDVAFAQEHALEVQLPFLQKVLGEFLLIPLIVGSARAEDVSRVIEHLYTERTLILISSDLSHYEDYETCRRHDQRTTQSIERLDGAAIDSHDACGAYPMRGLLMSARDHHWTVQTLDLRNSGDTAGDRARVVGYGAYRLA